VLFYLEALAIARRTVVTPAAARMVYTQAGAAYPNACARPRAAVRKAVIYVFLPSRNERMLRKFIVDSIVNATWHSYLY